MNQTNSDQLNILKDIYNDNIQWLNFAELKNGALVTVTGVICGIIIQLEIPLYVKVILVCICAIILFVGGLSFTPFLNTKKMIVGYAKKAYQKKGYKNVIDDVNIVFYVNIFLSEEDDYTYALQSTLTACNGFCKLEKTYIRQIIQIAKIASIKYFIFESALKLYLVFFIAIIILAIIA